MTGSADREAREVRACTGIEGSARRSVRRVRVTSRRGGTAPGHAGAFRKERVVELNDLAAQHREIAAEVREGFERVVSTAAFVGGDDVRAFEREFAAYCHTGACVGVANGTDAIEMVLRALHIARGDEVVVPANTFVATAEAVVRAGATPVFVDCDDTHLLIDPAEVRSRLTYRTRAIVGVDLYGQIAPFERLVELVDERNIALIEDAAQSQGARRYGASIGANVVAATTSFYPGKNLGAYGDGGAVITNDSRLAEAVRAIGNHGGLHRYEHELPGFNSRLDTLQAVVLRAKLRRLERWNDARRRAAARYDAAFRDHAAIRTVPAMPGNDHVWHLYVVRVAERDRVLAHLQEHGIAAAIHYPTPLHLTGAFAGLGHTPGAFPNAEAAASSVLSLPLHPHLSEADQDRVCHVLLEAVT